MIVFDATIETVNSTIKRRTHGMAVNETRAVNEMCLN